MSHTEGEPYSFTFGKSEVFKITLPLVYYNDISYGGIKL